VVTEKRKEGRMQESQSGTTRRDKGQGVEAEAQTAEWDGDGVASKPGKRRKTKRGGKQRMMDGRG